VVLWLVCLLIQKACSGLSVHQFGVMLMLNNTTRRAQRGAVSDKLFILGIVGFFTMMFSLGTYLTILAKEDARARVKLALQTEIKELQTAMTQDGFAWVKVRFEAASSSVVLSCAGRDCLWKQHESRRYETESKVRDGKWEKEKVLKIDRSIPEKVAVRLVAGTTELYVDTWKNIEVCESLLLIDNGILAEDDAQKTNTAKTSSDKDERDLYLPAGSDGWVFGKFEGGQPRGDETNSFYFSGKDREGFAQDTSGFESLLTIIQVVLSTISSFLAIIFFWILFGKSSSEKATASSD